MVHVVQHSARGHADHRQAGRHRFQHHVALRLGAGWEDEHVRGRIRPRECLAFQVPDETHTGGRLRSGAGGIHAVTRYDQVYRLPRVRGADTAVRVEQHGKILLGR